MPPIYGLAAVAAPRGVPIGRSLRASRRSPRPSPVLGPVPERGRPRRPGARVARPARAPQKRPPRAVEGTRARRKEGLHPLGCGGANRIRKELSVERWNLGWEVHALGARRALFSSTERTLPHKCSCPLSLRGMAKQVASPEQRLR